MIPTVAYTIVFNFASVFLTVEIPQIFIPTFHLGPQEIGLQFIGLIVGSIIGEQLGGPMSDFFINRRTKKLGRAPEPEYRLTLSYFGFFFAMLGLILFGVQVANATSYNVSPIVMIGISGAGNQIITTVLVSYAIDCHPEQSSSIGVFVNAIRSFWAFIGPFWFPAMIETIGVAASGGLMAALIFGTSVIPIVLLHVFGRQWRANATVQMGSTGGRGD